MSLAACKVVINEESRSNLESLCGAMAAFERVLFMLHSSNQEKFADEAAKLDKEIQESVSTFLNQYRDLSREAANLVGTSR